SAPVGQASTHAPHDTHSDSRKDSSWLAAIVESMPRPCTVSANVPCTSSHARTQREHTMHRFGSNAKYGLLSSFSNCGVTWPGYGDPVTPCRSAMFCNSQ